jgi:beta-glucosidase
MNSSLPPEQRARLLVNAMTLDQKIQQLHGQGSRNIPEFPACGNAIRHLQGIPEMNIPTFRITNGPVGIGQGDCTPTSKATALPSSLALAAGFDPTLAQSYGDLMGSEAVSVGVQVVEGPGMNLLRVPQGGRNFEYLGEDPMLAGTMATEVIRGIQSHNVIAMSKHYMGNEQENNRQSVNDIIDERTMAEMYLLPFEMTVKDGDVASLMCAYNLVNGLHACESPAILTDFLRTRWGFKGYVQSDFGATHSTAPALRAGEDLEMPNNVWFSSDNIRSAISAGSLTETDLNNALLRRYTQMFKHGQFDRPLTMTPIDQTSHGAIARSIGEQSAVLLRNSNNTLPLSCLKQQIALVGPANVAGSALLGGGGSSRVSPLYTVDPLTGLRNACPAATVTLYTVTDATDLASAVSAAKAADIAIVEVGDVESEGRDRAGVGMTGAQLPDDIVSAIANAQPHTVVVLKNGDPVTLPWANSVPAILEVWYPGEEDGNIVADLLFGKANPSGKTPATFPVAAKDVPANTPAQYPGVTVGGVPTAYYSEGLEIGYRWYDQRDISPLYPFGFGLSYTTFSISQIAASPAINNGTQPIKISARVKNTGNRRGAEVVQAYLGLPTSLGEPPKRLAGFQKVWLNPGEEQSVTITIDPSASSHPMSYWSVAAHDWVIKPGTYAVYVGKSSRDISSTIFTYVVSGLTGDVNGDGQVNCRDIFAAIGALGTSAGDAKFLPAADTDSNGKIDITDIISLGSSLPSGTACR